MNTERKEPQRHWPEIEGYGWTTNSDGWPSKEILEKVGDEFETEPIPFSAEALQKLYAKLWEVALEDVKVIKLSEYMNMPPDIEYGVYRKK